MNTNNQHLVVVGASAAGSATARAVRSAGWQGAVTLVGDEVEPPYDRPPLSKQVLTGEWDADRVRLHPPHDFPEQGIDLLLGHRATQVNIRQRTVGLMDGTTLPWSHLVIATGVRPRRIPMLQGGANVHQVRTLSDALGLRSRLRPGSRLVLVGGGFIGLEIAAAGRTAECRVDVVEQAALPLADRLGTTVGRRVRDLHGQADVTFHLGERVVAADWEGDVVTALELSSGEWLDVDTVVIGVGSVPAVDWLHGSGLGLSDGVDCDSQLRAAPRVWAAGDVANVVDPVTGDRRRHEHRFGANHHAQVIAAAITGGPAPTPRPPYMWTDQYDTKIQVIGRPPAGAEPKVIEGHLEGDSFIGAWTAYDQIEALVAWNAAPRLLNRYRRDLNEVHAAHYLGLPRKVGS